MYCKLYWSNYQTLLEPMKLTPMGVITPILPKKFNKFHNTLKPLGQAPGSSLPVYSDRFRVHLYCQTFGPSKVCALMPSLNRNCCVTYFELSLIGLPAGRRLHSTSYGGGSTTLKTVYSGRKWKFQKIKFLQKVNGRGSHKSNLMFFD